MRRLKVPGRCPKCDIELFCHTMTRTTMSLGQVEARSVTNYSLKYKEPAPIVNMGPDGHGSGSGLSVEAVEVECSRCDYKFVIDCADKHSSDQSGENTVILLGTHHREAHSMAHTVDIVMHAELLKEMEGRTFTIEKVQLPDGSQLTGESVNLPTIGSNRLSITFKELYDVRQTVDSDGRPFLEYKLNPPETNDATTE